MHDACESHVDSLAAIALGGQTIGSQLAGYLPSAAAEIRPPLRIVVPRALSLGVDIKPRSPDSDESVFFKKPFGDRVVPKMCAE